MLNPFFEPPMTTTLDPVADHRAAVARAAQERAALRRSQLDAQCSPAAAPMERIRLWEQLHGLRLPRAPQHKLLQVIAHDTGLTTGQVEEEQLRRASPPTREPSP